MAKRTQVYQQMPWLGGRNSTLDAAIVPNNQLVVADNTLFSTDLARRKRPGFQAFDSSSVGADVRMLAGIDYWANVANVKTQRQVVITNQPKIYSYDGLGNRTEITRLIGSLNLQDLTFTASASPALPITGNTWTIAYTDGATAGSEVVTQTQNAFSVQIQSGVSTAAQVVTALMAFPGFTAHLSVVVTPAPAAPATLPAAGVASHPQVVVAATPLLYGLPMVSGFSDVVTEVINEDLVIAFNNTTTPKKWSKQAGTVWQELLGSPPNFAFCRSHINRLFAAGVPEWPDRLFYSSPENHEEWNGAGDSGAIDIMPGDGDPEGITGIFPTTKGALFVAKRDRLYRINTANPDQTLWTISEVSKGLGCIGHNSIVAVGQDDMLHISDRGVHSMSATLNFGDFESAYLSKDIQKEFQTWNKLRLKQTRMAYVPELNSVIIAVSPDGYDVNVQMHLLNVEDKQWYRFPNVTCEAMWKAKLDNRDVLMVGDNQGRIRQLSKSTYNDDGAAIRFDVKTGTIYPDTALATVKAFKKLSLFYKPKEATTITALFKIDNFAAQQLVFDTSGDFDPLGVDFVLGTSPLGIYQPLPVITLPVDGHGRGFSLELIQSGVNEQTEIYGFAVEYESAGDQQETDK